ncbi:MAG: BTAD domain-containing putative transcriptional regulator [Acidimicrobiia bacterium]
MNDVSDITGQIPSAEPVPLVRPRLLTAVQARWVRPVTAVVAGAGFGKSTLLAQAVKENRLARMGVDVVLRIEPADASAVHLASRLLMELGLEGRPLPASDDLAGLVVDALWSRAPTPICLVLDDVHEIAPDTDGLRLLRDLVAARPGNTHVLLGSRTLPEVGIARLAVLGDAVVLREDDLRFDAAETVEFARLRGVDHERVAAADGWPALAELLARTTGVSTGDYVWEQVVVPLRRQDRARLVEVAALGGADDDLASAVAGRAVVLAASLADVPLVTRSPEGWWELHEVVAEPILARQEAGLVADIRRRGGIHASARGDTDRALRLLVASGDHDEVMAALRTAFVQLGAPEDPSLASVWAALLPAAFDREPEVLLLRAVAATVTDPERAFDLGEAAVAAFVARGDLDGEVAAFARLGAIAYGLADPARMAPHVPRISELAAAGHAWAVAFDSVCRGAFALMTGDWRRAEEVLAPVVAEPERDPTQGLAAYLCARAQVEGGRLHEAARTVRHMPLPDRERVRDGVLGVEFAVAQGLGADDAVFDELRLSLEARLDRRPLVARRNARSRLASVQATLGDLDGAREQLIELEMIGPPSDATLDEEILAAAAVAVLAGAEDEAAAMLERLPDRGAFFPPREGLVVMFVLRPESRERYDALDLEGAYAHRRDFAAAFVAAREGDLEPMGRFAWPRASVARWFAPAPWLVEAVVLSLAGGGNPPPELLARLGPSQRAVVRRLGASAMPTVARNSAAVAASLGPEPPGTLAIRVLGPLEVDIGGVGADAPELRRERVRSLLGLLVLRRSVLRGEAAAALWPELGGEQALANLRVTLTHLLKLLEPTRAKNGPPYFIRLERELLTLRPDAALQVDAWDFECAAAEGERMEREGAPSVALDAFVRAVGLWRGGLLADVGCYEWLDFERIRLGNLFVRSALRAGELLAAHHQLEDAALMAHRVIAADRWAEAGYRLLASVHLEEGDRSAARRVLAHLRSMLDELGVGPEQETLAVMRRCDGG